MLPKPDQIPSAPQIEPADRANPGPTGEPMTGPTMPEAVPPTQVASAEAQIVAALGARPIVLIGMMGAGKTTIGRRLAARLKLPFVDTDIEIEAGHAGMSIPEIFAKYGEPYFRDGEARVIARLLGEGPCVLATGGGAFMREETRRRVRAEAVSIWLKADADVILRRVKRRSDRPLLQTEDPLATIKKLIEQRHPLYQEADLTILSHDVPHDRIVDDCIAALRGHVVGAAGTCSDAI
jgi:shikimate kinase